MPRVVVAQGTEMGTSVHPRKPHSEGLTSIHTRIHCVATTDTLEEADELDRIDIDNFLSTLAEVATAVVRREQQADHESGSLHQSQ